MNNKIKGSMLLILSLCFAFYAAGQILAVTSSSTDKLDEPIQLISGQSYQFHYKHNIWDSFNNYKISLAFENKPALPWEVYEVKNIKYSIHVICQNKNRILYNLILDKNNLRINSFGYENINYAIYRYNYNIYEPSEYTLILKVLKTDPILAELNPRVKVYSFLECGLEGLFWLPMLLIGFILFILTFVFGIKFLVTKSK